MAFLELIQPKLDPIECQKMAGARFPEVARAHGFEVWTHGELHGEHTEFLLIGVAPRWNRYDLLLLDYLSERIDTVRSQGIFFQLFDVDHRDLLDRAMAYLEQPVAPVATPFVFFRRDATITNFIQSAPAITYILNMFDVDDREYRTAASKLTFRG